MKKVNYELQLFIKFLLETICKLWQVAKKKSDTYTKGLHWVNFDHSSGIWTKKNEREKLIKNHSFLDNLERHIHPVKKQYLTEQRKLESTNYYLLLFQKQKSKCKFPQI